MITLTLRPHLALSTQITRRRRARYALPEPVVRIHFPPAASLRTSGPSVAPCRLAELPPDQEIVAYCRGPWCVLSFEALALLRHRGYRARRLEDGFPEWKTAGLPIDSP